MGKLITRPFEFEQLKRYAPRGHEAFAPHMYDFIATMARGSVTLSLIEEETELVVALGGIMPLWPGVAEAWMLASNLVHKYPRAVYRTGRNFLAMNMQQMRLNRVQCSIVSTEEHLKEFVAHMGFVDEGVMRKYGPLGEDHNRFAKVI